MHVRQIYLPRGAGSCAPLSCRPLRVFSVTERWVIIARAGLASAWEVEGDRIRMMEEVSNANVRGRARCRGWVWRGGGGTR